MMRFTFLDSAPDLDRGAALMKEADRLRAAAFECTDGKTVGIRDVALLLKSLDLRDVACRSIFKGQYGSRLEVAQMDVPETGSSKRARPRRQS